MNEERKRKAREASARYYRRHDGAKRMREWRKNNPEKLLEANRRQRLKKYGLSEKDYEDMLEAQHGGCAVCKGPQQRGYRFAVDHCHKTGRVRGLLCDNCNRAIGFMADEPDRLRAAADYLEGAR